jgi:TnpA family transposase
MSACVRGISVDMLRHVLHDFVREDTLTAASAEIVNQHHTLPLSALHGTGTLSSSAAQRFGIRASRLLAAYYPRYYGYYDKAIGIYKQIPENLSRKGCAPKSVHTRLAQWVSPRCRPN